LTRLEGVPFLVFTSNIFAILGLRSMYFLLAGLMDYFRFLKISLAVVLGYIGVKMLLPLAWPNYKTSNLTSLAVIGAILALGILVSLIVPRRELAEPSPLETEPGSE
jgi:tellurite resistance protein TerC